VLRIRLRRMGKKKQPAPRDGAFVEIIGHYHPLANPSTIVLNSDRARHWLDRGAQPSDRVAKLLAIEGLAELPPKLQTRMELGRKRAEEAMQAKPKEEAASAATAEAPAPPAAAEGPAAEEPPAPEAPAAEKTTDEGATAPEAEATGEPSSERTEGEEGPSEE